jgi:hypothetical protein
VSRLPEKYRLPFILCHLEGLTNEQAANHLGCPTGTVLSRLSRARERLRDRLQMRGVVLSAGALVGLLSTNVAQAVSAALVATTAHAATIALSTGAATATSPLVGILVQGALHEMVLAKIKTIVAVVLAVCVGAGGSVLLVQTLAQTEPMVSTQPAEKPGAKEAGGVYAERFLALWKDLHNEKNGYFSPEGIPYHSVETLIIEAPDHGHMTTSEAFSYWIWLEAAYGRQTGDWTRLQKAMESLEKHIIPSPKDQPTNRGYLARKPASYAAEFPTQAGYPAPLDFGIPVGSDPLDAELKTAYGTGDIYAMHWLLDVDNWYGYGQRSDGKSRPSCINTFQRGPTESVWHTVPHPSWESFKWGGKRGFLDLLSATTTRLRSGATPWRPTPTPGSCRQFTGPGNGRERRRSKRPYPWTRPRRWAIICATASSTSTSRSPAVRIRATREATVTNRPTT